jgi:phage-related protein
LRHWSGLYGIPLGGHHRKAFSKEQKIALLEGFQKQSNHTTIESYEKANNVKKNVLGSWSRSYGIPLGFHHTKVLPKERKIALLEGFQKQSNHTTVSKYAKANNVRKEVLFKWSALYGIPLGSHHRKVLSKERKIALLEGFQKQNTHTTIADYAKANNVSMPALCRWAALYGVRLGYHYAWRRIQKTPHGSR